MGALIRSFDWSATVLGPAAAWPQSLKTAASIMLDSHFGMYIAWGPEFIQLYNDLYRPILGSTKHPAVGRRTRDTFAESWQIIGPLFERVMQGQAVGANDWMLPLDRHGYLEECFFTFSYSPIRDESGDVGGVLVTVTETTERVLNDRRLRTLRELAAGAAAGGTEAGAWADAIGASAAMPPTCRSRPLTSWSTTAGPRGWRVWPARGSNGCRCPNGSSSTRMTRGPSRPRWRPAAPCSSRTCASDSATSSVPSGPSRCWPPRSCRSPGPASRIRMAC